MWSSVPSFFHSTLKIYCFKPGGTNRKLKPFLQGSLLCQSCFWCLQASSPPNSPRVLWIRYWAENWRDHSAAEVLTFSEFLYHVCLPLGNTISPCHLLLHQMFNLLCDWFVMSCSCLTPAIGCLLCARSTLSAFHREGKSFPLDCKTRRR